MLDDLLFDTDPTGTLPTVAADDDNSGNGNVDPRRAHRQQIRGRRVHGDNDQEEGGSSDGSDSGDEDDHSDDDSGDDSNNSSGSDNDDGDGELQQQRDSSAITVPLKAADVPSPPLRPLDASPADLLHKSETHTDLLGHTSFNSKALNERLAATDSGNSCRNPLWTLIGDAHIAPATSATIHDRVGSGNGNSSRRSSSLSRELELLEKVSVLKRMLLSERQQRVAERHRWSRVVADLSDMKELLAKQEEELVHLRDNERKLLKHASTSEHLQQQILQQQQQQQQQQLLQNRNYPEMLHRDVNSDNGLSSSLPTSARDAVPPPMNKSVSTSHRFFKGFANNRTMQEQLHSTLQEIASLKETNLALQQQHLERIEDMQSLTDAKTRMLEETTLQLAQYRQRSRDMGEENSELQIRIANMLHAKRQADMQIQVMQERMRAMEHSITALRDQLKAKDGEVTHLTDELRAKNDTVGNMARQLVDMKQQMESLSLMLRKFTVRTGKGVEAHIHLQKNPSTGMLTLAIISAGKHSVYPLKAVDSFEKHADSLTRFEIELPSGTSVFEAGDEEEREEIISALREFIKAQAIDDEQQKRR